jgi:NADPH-dependent curcumin reductase CurA
MDSQSFIGLESVADAVEWLHSGKNIGKVIVELTTKKSKL